ncbi:hypothetical protein D3C74_84080 [compost metagenome]
MKWISWMVRKTLSIVMIVALTLLTTGYVVNAYVQSLLGMFNIKLEGTSVLGLNIGQDLFGSKQPSAGEGGEGGKSGTLNGTSNSTVEGTQGERKPTDSTDEGLPNGSAASSSTSNSPAHGQEIKGSTPGGMTGSPTSGDEESTPEGALPVMGTADDEDTPAAAPSESSTPPALEEHGSLEEEELVMTPGDLVDRKDELNKQQKQEILSMLMNKLPAEDMQMISTAMEGGLTEKELQDIQQVIAKRLTNEEYTKLMEMLKVGR